MKRGVIFLFFFLIAITSVNAQTSSYSKQDALNWLFNETKGDEGVEEVSMGLLALNSNGFRIDVPLTVFLQKNLDSNCFPKGNCGIKETSFALLSLGKLNQDTKSIEKWINDSLKDAYVGKWLIQIASGGQGSCTVKSGDKEISVDVNGNEELVKDGRKIGNWIDVERDLKNIDITGAVSVNCPSIGSNVAISLLRQKNTNDFIISKEVQGNSAMFNIDNACYGLNGCDPEASFYAAWVLSSLNREVYVVPYLEDTASDSLVYNSILGKITNKERFYANLANKQGVNGDFGNNVFVTSMVVDALKGNTAYQSNVTKALLWLQYRQLRDSATGNGSLDNSEFFTSSAVYLALKEGSVIPPRVNVNGTIGGGYCGDTIVDLQLGEECDSSIDTIKEGAQKDCERSCDVLSCKCNKPQCKDSNECNTPKEYCDVASSQCVVNQTIRSCKSNVDCNSDETCDIVKGNFCLPKPSGEQPSAKGCKIDSDCTSTSQTCDIATGKCMEKEEKEVLEAECGNNICEREEDETSCPVDCKKEKQLPMWVWIVIAIVSLVLIAYILYSKFVKTPPKTKKMFYEPKTNTVNTQAYYKPVERSKKDEALERELDRSINEAQSLLKKK